MKLTLILTALQLEKCTNPGAKNSRRPLKVSRIRNKHEVPGHTKVEYNDNGYLNNFGRIQYLGDSSEGCHTIGHWDTHAD